MFFFFGYTFAPVSISKPVIVSALVKFDDKYLHMDYAFVCSFFHFGHHATDDRG